MAFSARRSFCESGIFRCATSSSNTSRIPQARSRGVSPSNNPGHRGLQGVHGLIQCGQVQINGQRLSGLRFLPPALLPGCFLGQLLLFFTFHFGGVVTLMMVFRLRTGVSPSVFRFSVSTGRFCSVMLCSASDESSCYGQRYHTRHSARTPSTAR